MVCTSSRAVTLHVPTSLDAPPINTLVGVGAFIGFTQANLQDTCVTTGKCCSCDEGMMASQAVHPQSSALGAANCMHACLFAQTLLTGRLCTYIAITLVVESTEAESQSATTNRHRAKPACVTSFVARCDHVCTTWAESQYVDSDWRWLPNAPYESSCKAALAPIPVLGGMPQIPRLGTSTESG